MKKNIFVFIIILMSVSIICSCTTLTPPNFPSNDTNTQMGLKQDETDDQNSNIKLEMNSITQSNKDYYTSINSKNKSYLGNDFPNEYGEYYKVVKTASEFEGLVNNLDSIDENLFEDNYIVILKRNYENRPLSTFIGFRNANLYDEDAYIIADCYFYSNRLYPEDVVEYNVWSYLIIPKSCVCNEEDGTVKKLNIIYNERNYYSFETISVPTEKINEADYGESWFLSEHTDLETLKTKFNIEEALFFCESENNYILAIYSEVLRYDYIGFKDFYTDGKNVFITVELTTNQRGTTITVPTIYLVEIPKDIIESKISGEIVTHYLIQKTEPLIIP